MRPALFLAVAMAASVIATGTANPPPARDSRPSATAPGTLLSRTVTWTDVAPLSPRLARSGLSAEGFDAWVARLSATHAQRVREGDLDHLVYYLLQSTHFTSRPAIEPALSAKALVETLPADVRVAFLDTGSRAGLAVPADVRARTRDLLAALQRPGNDVRRRYFADLVTTTFPDAATRASALELEYLRVMRFLYEKEFVAQRAAHPAEAVATLYRARGLSTDTAAEAGYLVSMGLGIVHALDATRRIRRVLLIGPGLDLAPRTGLLEAGEPESYQPWAVIDALVSQGLASLPDLEVVAADINPRVVSHLERARTHPPLLRFVSGIADDGRTTLSRDYREYFAGLGRSIGTVVPSAVAAPPDARLRRAVQVQDDAARTLTAASLDVVVSRFTRADFDLVVITNVLPYFDDDELALTVSNIASMLAPGGLFLHNEARPALQELTAAVGLPLEQSRHAVIATVAGAAAPLYDSVWVHRKR